MNKKNYITPMQSNRSLVLGCLMLKIVDASPDPDTGVLTKDRHNNPGDNFVSNEDDEYGNLW